MVHQSTQTYLILTRWLPERELAERYHGGCRAEFGPAGYERRHDNGRGVFRGAPINPDIFDIDKMAARRRELAERYEYSDFLELY